MFNSVRKICTDAIDRRIFPGCAVGVVMKGRCWYGAYGKFTYDSASRSVEETTVYDVASITKAIPVSCCALKLIEDGKLSLNDRLIDVLPEFCGGYREKIIIWHLLTHTIDFGFQLSSLKQCSSNEIMGRILSAQLRSEPGSFFSYANATSVLLGLVVERKCGLQLDIAANDLFFKPLGMKTTTFNPEKLDISAVAPSEYDTWRGRLLCAEVHDESTYALRPRIVGSAGLFSSMPDIVEFIKMLLQDGQHEGAAFFSKETVAAMHNNALPESFGMVTGLGWELDQPFMGSLRNRQTFGKTGFTGCSVTVDPVRQAAIVLLSNHVFPKRQEDRSLINSVRALLADTVFEICDAK